MTPNSDHDEFGRAFDAAFARLQVEVEAACGDDGEWPEKVAAGVRATFEFAVAYPDAATVLTSGALSRGREGFERYERMLDHMGRCLAAGRAISIEADLLPETTEKALVGGISMLIAQRLSDGRGRGLTSVTREATQLLLTPYVGGEKARRLALRFDRSRER